MGRWRRSWLLSRSLELGALVLGSLFGLGLLVAGLWLQAESPAAGRLALADTVGRVADAVEREWQRWRDDPDIVVVEQLRWRAPPTSGTTASATERPGTLDTLVAPATADEGDVRSEAYQALLSQALQLELRDRDSERALDAVLAALRQPVDAAGRALARLRAIQLAVGRRPDVAREQWFAVLDEQSGREVDGDTSTLLLSALAVAPALDRGERRAAHDQLVERWLSGALSLPGGALALERGDDGQRVLRVPEVQLVLARRLDALAEAPGGDSGTRPEVVPDAPPRPPWLQRDLDLRLGALLAEAFGTAPAALPEGRVGVQVLGDEALVYRDDEGLFRGAFVSLDALGGALLARLDRAELLPEGFSVVCPSSVDDDAAPTVVRPSAPLSPGLRFRVEHSDPAGFIAAEARRMEPLRLGLLGMGALSLLAGLVSFEALRRQRRLHALKARFIANVSHELRTPVTAILLNSERLSGGRAHTSERRERYQGLIRKEALRLERLVEDVLDFSRLERGEGPRLQRHDVDLTHWATGLAEECGGRARAAGLAFEAALDALPDDAPLDGEALRRAVANLVDNALKHSGARALQLSVGVRDQQLQLAVSDDGRGVPREHRETIFEPFRQADGDGTATGGTGLGLAIVREIAQAHGGSVRCEAGPDSRGSVFRIAVPLPAADGVRASWKA